MGPNPRVPLSKVFFASWRVVLEGEQDLGPETVGWQLRMWWGWAWLQGARTGEILCLPSLAILSDFPASVHLTAFGYNNKG